MFQAVEYGHMISDSPWRLSVLAKIGRLLEDAQEQPMTAAQCGRCGADWAFSCGGSLQLRHSSRYHQESQALQALGTATQNLHSVPSPRLELSPILFFPILDD